MKIQNGAQTYAWQMSYEKYVGKIPYILDSLKSIGMTGVEIDVAMLGDIYFNNPGLLREEMEKRGMTLIALGAHIAWGIDPRDEIIEHCRKCILLGKAFDEPTIISYSLVPPEHVLPDVPAQQAGFLELLTEVSGMAIREGLIASFHTNSSPTSVFHTPEDYNVLFDFFDSHPEIRYTPDAGHIANGGMDPVEVFRRFAPFIEHVHFKDRGADGRWAPMGKGKIDFPGIMKVLYETGYDRWVIVEEESDEAVADPEAVMRDNAEYLRKINP